MSENKEWVLSVQIQPVWIHFYLNIFALNTVKALFILFQPANWLHQRVVPSKDFLPTSSCISNVDILDCLGMFKTNI